MDRVAHLRRPEVVRRVEQLALPEALRLLLRLSERWDGGYQDGARHFLVRVLVEIEPPLIEAKRLADAMAHTRHGYFGPFATDALRDVVAQLERRERRLAADFSSLPE